MDMLRSSRAAGRAAVVAIALMTGVGCSLRGQIGQLVTFLTSDIRLRSVDQARLAGIDVRDLRRRSDLGLDDLARLAITVAGGTLPLDLRLTLESENTSDAPAAIHRLEWKLRLDDVEVASGTSPVTVTLPARSVQAFPLDVRSDLRAWAGERSRDALADLVVGLFDPERRQPRVVLAIRPTFEIFGQPRTSPRYIDVPIRVPRLGAP